MSPRHQRPPAIKASGCRVALRAGHGFTWRCFLTLRRLTSFGSDTLEWVSLQREMDRERLLKYRSPQRARFQQEKMKVVKANFGNQEFQSMELTLEGEWQTKTAGLDGSTPDLLHLEWKEISVLSPQPGSHTHAVHTSAPPRHHTLTRVSKISCRKPESLSTQYRFKPLVKSPCMTDTLVCVGSQLRHSDFLTPHSDHVLQKTWWNLVNSQFSLIQGRRIFRAKQKIRTTDFHTYWSGLFEKPLMITERILGYESWYNK